MVLSIPILDQLHTLLLYGAAIITGISLYLHTHSFSAFITPLSTLLPVTGAVLGIICYHWWNGYFLSYCLCFATCFFLTPPAIRLIMAHAILCFCYAYCMLTLDAVRYQEKTTLLTKKNHTIEGLVVESEPWADKGNMITVNVIAINHMPCTGYIKFCLYSTQSVDVGTQRLFFNVKITPQETKPLLAGYGLRDHLLGTQFAPFLKTRIIRTSSLYSKWLAHKHTARTTLFNALEKKLSPQVFTYVSSLFLGNKKRDDFLPMRTTFTRWGLTHYLARSGLHISLLVSLWAKTLQLLPVPLSIKSLFLFLMLGIYDYFSWANISFNRALWLWFFYLASWFTSAYATPLFGFNHLTLALLLLNPWYAGCLDFQLSFFLTGILLLLSYYKKQQVILSYCANKNK